LPLSTIKNTMKNIDTKAKSLPAHLNRRGFLKLTTAAGAAIAAPMILPASARGANERINMAWIGAGFNGSGHLRGLPADQVNLVAFCDADKHCPGRAINERYPHAEFYQDYRIMLEKLARNIDAVGIATPDHTHFACAHMALMMGKHVFVEKPMTHTVAQARILRKLANEQGVKTQMGNQGHASEGIRLIKEWYEAGLVGDVREIIAWTNRPATGSGFRGASPREYPPAQDVPASLDWDLWRGPAPESIAYNSAFHPRFWRGWWAFGCGGLGDIGCHTLDTPFWAMSLGAPKRVDVELQEEPNPIHTPNGAVVAYHFEVPNGKPPVTIKWYEGPTEPKLPQVFGLPENAYELNPEGGLIMIGDKGVIAHPGMRPDSPRLYPDALWQDFRTNPDMQPERRLPRVRGGIMGDFLDCIRNDGTPTSDFNYAAPLTEVIALGTLAIRTGQAIEFDSQRMRIPNNPAADAMLRA